MCRSAQTVKRSKCRSEDAWSRFNYIYIYIGYIPIKGVQRGWAMPRETSFSRMDIPTSVTRARLYSRRSARNEEKKRKEKWKGNANERNLWYDGEFIDSWPTMCVYVRECVCVKLRVMYVVEASWCEVMSCYVWAADVSKYSFGTWRDRFRVYMCTDSRARWANQCGIKSSEGSWMWGRSTTDVQPFGGGDLREDLLQLMYLFISLKCSLWSV